MKPDYYLSILRSLEDLRAARAPAHIWRELDRQVAEVRDMFVEYRAPKGKTLCEVFAEETSGQEEVEQGDQRPEVSD